MELNQLFCDGMILQADKPVRVFGKGAGKASVRFNGAQAKGTFTGEDWLLELPAMPYGGPYEMAVKLDGSETILRDVWVGDVYLLAGQSNMQMKLADTDFPKNLYRPLPNVRLFSTRRAEDNEHFKPEDGWVPARKEEAGYWSALGWLTAMFLTERKSCKIGLIECYQGAAAIQTYLPDRVFEEHPEYDIPYGGRGDMMWKWNEIHSILWHFQFEGILPFPMSAVLWYQGESNWREAESLIYDKLLTALLRSWREDLRDPKLPFVIVQIADYKPREGASWSRIQEAQARVAAEDPYAELVVCRDVCENDQIHPKKKSILARRMADAVLLLEANR